MQLDVRAAAAALKIPETTLFRWIDQKRLPATGVDGHYRFGRAELLEWVASNRADLACDLFDEDSSLNQPLLLTPALEAGGIYYDLPASSKEEALRSLTGKIPLPADCTGEMLYQLLVARDAIGVTTVGQGIAIPHPRCPLILSVPRPTLSLCAFSPPLDLSPTIRKGLRALFVLICPTIRDHLQLVARLMSLVREDRFVQALAAQKSPDEMLSEVRRLEKALAPAAASANGSSKSPGAKNGTSQVAKGPKKPARS